MTFSHFIKGEKSVHYFNNRYANDEKANKSSKAFEKPNPSFLLIEFLGRIKWLCFKGGKCSRQR